MYPALVAVGMLYVEPVALSLDNPEGNPLFHGKDDSGLGARGGPHVALPRFISVIPPKGKFLMEENFLAF